MFPLAIINWKAFPSYDIIIFLKKNVPFVSPYTVLQCARCHILFWNENVYKFVLWLSTVGFRNKRPNKKWYCSATTISMVKRWPAFYRNNVLSMYICERLCVADGTKNLLHSTLLFQKICLQPSIFFSTFNDQKPSVAMAMALYDKRVLVPLQWRHNEHPSVSNYRRLSCLFNRVLRLTSKEISKPTLLALCGGNTPLTDGFPSQSSRNAETVSIWWRHYAIVNMDLRWRITMRRNKKCKLWVRSRNSSCLVTWFCYQLIAKPGNKTATVSWPDPIYIIMLSKKKSTHKG